MLPSRFCCRDSFYTKYPCFFRQTSFTCASPLHGWSCSALSAGFFFYFENSPDVSFPLGSRLPVSPALSARRAEPRSSSDPRRAPGWRDQPCGGHAVAPRTPCSPNDLGCVCGVSLGQSDASLMLRDAATVLSAAVRSS